MPRLIPDTTRATQFILANTGIHHPPHVPEIALHLADEAHELWHKTEEELSEIGLPPPYWAFAWAGGQGVARYILDHPQAVQNKRILDFASGSGLVGIAALLSGASSVIANDIDPFARHAISLNTTLNKVSCDFSDEDLIGQDVSDTTDVLLAGDVFYDKPLADKLIPWFDMLAAKGVQIIVGDPGRSYLPRHRLKELEVYSVPVTRALEDADVKRTTVWYYGKTEQA
ncbi:methyltransferase [Pseudochrobactrum sp. sp1633]|uniref:class I SAM-dependent methyltransferase n=1 Tax=Pseudochrobactrum sp. sp1633 TaxID=3036706 RepID=UPI0025A679CB|nr:methyltransferase [Pseudochrobactrum sp. sp1633]MDM8345066.1 methyltransferase [Pseudochrobactrum sp. sp1633]HWD14899.1 methyltransferase [Pseudochrobactrum sp.]